MSAQILQQLTELTDDDEIIFYDDTTWNTALHLAAAKCHLTIVRHLAARGFPVNLQNIHGQSALHLATSARDLAICKCLVDAGADPLLQDGVRSSPLDIATGFDDYRLVSLFLQNPLPLPLPALYVGEALQERRKNVIRAFGENGYPLTFSHPSCNFLHAMAAVSNDELVFQKLLDAGVNVNLRDTMGASALHIAAQRCSNPKILQMLLDKGADPNSKDCSEFRGTPLFAATLGGRYANAAILLSRGANLKYRVGGRSLLHIAAQQGIPELVGLYIKEGLNVNDLDETGATPAYWAVLNNHVSSVKFLLGNGLDLSIEPAGLTIGRALANGDIDLVQLLVDYGAQLNFERHYTRVQENTKNINTMPLLLLLCKNSSVDMSNIEIMNAGSLAKHHPGTNTNGDTEQVAGASALLKIPEGKMEVTPLGFHMVGGGRESAVPEQPEEHKSGDGSKSGKFLKLLMQCRQFETAAAAIEYGADCSPLSPSERGLLCLISAGHDLRQGVSAMIRVGAPTNQKISVTFDSQQGDVGWTALHLAAFRGYLVMVRILRRGGWNMCAEDKRGYTAMHIAASEGHLEIVEELLGTVDLQQITTDKSTALHLAAEHGHASIVNRLLEARPAMAHSCRADGQTALHRACQFDYVEIATLLVVKGSNVAKKDETGTTPLLLAAQSGSSKVLKFLLSLGTEIDLNARAMDGSTALHLAVRHSKRGVLRAMLKAGADPNLLNAQGQSPLEAAVTKDIRMVETLFSRTHIRWNSPRQSHVLFHAFRSGNSEVAGFVLRKMESRLGDKKANIVMRQLFSEILAEVLMHTNPAPSIGRLLIPYFPEDKDEQYKFAAQMLFSVIKHSDDVGMAEELVRIHPVLARQATIDNWRPIHSACKHGREKIVKLLLRYGADRELNVKVLNTQQTAISLARKYAPTSSVAVILDRFERMTEAVQRYPESRIAWFQLQEPDEDGAVGLKRRWWLRLTG